jgi:hypothetical protein
VKSSEDRLRADIDERQRNVMPEDTIRNDGHFLRAFGKASTPKTRLQKVGGGIVGAAMLTAPMLEAGTQISRFFGARDKFLLGGDGVDLYWFVLLLAMGFYGYKMLVGALFSPTKTAR